MSYKKQKIIIEVKGVSKKIRDNTILDNINLQIFEGEIFGLLGPNGSGKTILIQTILGTVEPDCGIIQLFNKKLKSNLSYIRKSINFASAYSTLQEQLTIMDNLRTFAGLYEINKPLTKINELVSFFGLEKKVKEKAKVLSLSSGENTRLLLCKALINNPKILFLDEPTASLDPYIALQLQKLIKKIHKKNKMTVVYASHNMSEVKNLCNRIAFLKKGKTVRIVNKNQLPEIYGLYKQ